MKQFSTTGCICFTHGIRLIKGSHIVVPRVHTQKQAYILQNEDKRIVFVIPWMDEFSIIGTTDVEYKGDPKAVKIEESEINYLLKVYNTHFKKAVKPGRYRLDLLRRASAVMMSPTRRRPLPVITPLISMMKTAKPRCCRYSAVS